VSHVIDSILTSVKRNLGLAEAYEAFDPDVIMHINSAFVRLHSLGIGPATGFAIEDKTVTWDAYLGTDNTLNNIKTYIYLKVKSLFDVPGTSYHTTAMQEQIRELEVLINMHRENTEWTEPILIVDDEEDLVLDGGGP
jgi:hypothetical protein